VEKDSMNRKCSPKKLILLVLFLAVVGAVIAIAVVYSGNLGGQKIDAGFVSMKMLLTSNGFNAGKSAIFFTSALQGLIKSNMVAVNKTTVDAANKQISLIGEIGKSATVQQAFLKAIASGDLEAWQIVNVWINNVAISTNIPQGTVNPPLPKAFFNTTAKVRVLTWCGMSNPNLVSLNFDDGPAIYGGQALAILDALSALNVKATFFLSPASDGADNMDRKCAVASQIAAQGHDVETLGWDHANLQNATNAMIKTSLDTSRQFIVNCTGRAPRYFRPPYGVLSLAQAEYVTSLGYTIALWTLDSQDWGNISSVPINIEFGMDSQAGNIIIMQELTSYQIVDQIVSAVLMVKPQAQFTSMEGCYQSCNQAVCYDVTHPLFTIQSWGAFSA